MLSRYRVDEEKKKTKRRMGVMANTTYFSHPSFRFLLPIFLLSLPAIRALRALRGLFLLLCIRTGGKLLRLLWLSGHYRKHTQNYLAQIFIAGYSQTLSCRLFIDPFSKEPPGDLLIDKDL
jgi:hypothetical protein